MISDRIWDLGVRITDKHRETQFPLLGYQKQRYRIDLFDTKFRQPEIMQVAEAGGIESGTGSNRKHMG